jgi:hypothetical protein
VRRLYNVKKRIELVEDLADRAEKYAMEQNVKSERYRAKSQLVDKYQVYTKQLSPEWREIRMDSEERIKFGNS